MLLLLVFFVGFLGETEALLVNRSARRPSAMFSLSVSTAIVEKVGVRYARAGRRFEMLMENAGVNNGLRYLTSRDLSVTWLQMEISCHKAPLRL